MDIVEISKKMNSCKICENQMVYYIQSLDIEKNIKELLISLIDNDNYSSYAQIYNICIENDIELPPL